jgi:hypothetical protein
MSRWHLGGKGLRKAGLLLSIIFTLVFSLAPFAHAQDVDDEDGHDSHARIVRLIRKWLKAGILEDGVVTVSNVGTGQGSVISPLLANVYLHCAPQPRWKGKFGMT